MKWTAVPFFRKSHHILFVYIHTCNCSSDFILFILHKYNGGSYNADNWDLGQNLSTTVPTNVKSSTKVLLNLLETIK